VHHSPLNATISKVGIMY